MFESLQIGERSQRCMHDLSSSIVDLSPDGLIVNGLADMLTSDDRKEVDLHLQRGSIAHGIFRDVLELVFFKYLIIGSCWRGGGGALTNMQKH